METEIEESVFTEEATSFPFNIIVYNDDINSFDNVITSFVEILGHQESQASQCAMIIHTNGKCGVKGGSYEELEPLCTALLDRKLSATIE